MPDAAESSNSAEESVSWLRLVNMFGAEATIYPVKRVTGVG